MTAQQFPPLPTRAAPEVMRAQLPDWPRLMGERMAADYLSIGTTQLRAKGPQPKKIGGRTLWDKRDLDRFADALAGQPLDSDDASSHAKDVERAWLEKRNRKARGDHG